MSKSYFTIWKHRGKGGWKSLENLMPFVFHGVWRKRKRFGRLLSTCSATLPRKPIPRRCTPWVWRCDGGHKVSRSKVTVGIISIPRLKRMGALAGLRLTLKICAALEIPREDEWPERKFGKASEAYKDVKSEKRGQFGRNAWAEQQCTELLCRNSQTKG